MDVVQIEKYDEPKRSVPLVRYGSFPTVHVSLVPNSVLSMQ